MMDPYGTLYFGYFLSGFFQIFDGACFNTRSCPGIRAQNLKFLNIHSSRTES